MPFSGPCRELSSRDRNLLDRRKRVLSNRFKHKALSGQWRILLGKKRASVSSTGPFVGLKGPSMAEKGPQSAFPGRWMALLKHDGLFGPSGPKRASCFKRAHVVFGGGNMLAPFFGFWGRPWPGCPPPRPPLVGGGRTPSTRPFGNVLVCSNQYLYMYITI